jgi:hypothetical protein
MDHLKGASLAWALALPANNRLGWKGLPRTNTLVYYEKLQITAVKSFIGLASVVTSSSCFTSIAVCSNL